MQFLGCIGMHAPARWGEGGGNGEESPHQSLKRGPLFPPLVYVLLLFDSDLPGI